MEVMINDLPEKVFERFGELVEAGEPDECWEWKGSKGYGGYGRMHVAISRGVYVSVYAHRIALFLAGVELAPKDKSLHSCDNPPCCNPYHLRPGTQLDNVQDRNKRGRTARGGYRPSRKLTDEMVLSAREKYLNGISIRELGRNHDVDYRTMWLCLKGLTYKAVK